MSGRVWMILGLGALMLAACSPKPSAQPSHDRRSSAPVSAPATAETVPAPIPPTVPQAPVPVDEKANWDDGAAFPTDNEMQMLGYYTGGMVLPPPIGSFGEPRSFTATSKTALAITGDITFEFVPPEKENDGSTRDLKLLTTTGLEYRLRFVPEGGVGALKALDWSQVMAQRIGMKDFLAGKSSQRGMLVFVYEVVGETVPTKGNRGGLCDKPKFVALSIPPEGEDYVGKTFTMAVFQDAAWPPKDASGLCATFHYVPETEDAQ